ADVFAPYPGFRAFPYGGYSRPWFDGRHRVLKGGSRHSGPWLRRPSMRNFYTPEKRHIFSGVRLATDGASGCPTSI
ncbi:MAG TPA: SUMF1/EgtB/PvdO family nonheme iron enzyme, partial [Acidiferrobacteraceae bacterium]|nr:SUMF1/EgtB/PvdO family nonheme iron enzyme [Acidiferrobacteraceae bacterium]